MIVSSALPAVQDDSEVIDASDINTIVWVSFESV